MRQKMIIPHHLRCYRNFYVYRVRIVVDVSWLLRTVLIRNELGSVSLRETW